MRGWGDFPQFDWLRLPCPGWNGRGKGLVLKKFFIPLDKFSNLCIIYSCEFETISHFGGHMKRTTYSTAQKLRLLTYLRDHKDEQFTVVQLAATLEDGSTGSPGRSTVYRQIAQLCTDGRCPPLRAKAGTNSFVYQYADNRADCNGEAHFHLKCVHCGRLLHLDWRPAGRSSYPYSAAHGFPHRRAHGILWGECAACMEGGDDQ